MIEVNHLIGWLTDAAVLHMVSVACVYAVCLWLFIWISASWLRLHLDAGDCLPPLSKMCNQAVDNGRLYDNGLISLAKMLVESFFFSFGYGTCTVLMCNAMLPGAVPDDIGWLIVLFAQFASCIFASTFSGNSIHIATSTKMHFFYYGSALLPIMLYEQLPHWWIVLGYSLYTLVFFVVARSCLYSDYPRWWSTHPLYSRDVWTGDPMLISMPRLGGDAFFRGVWENGLFTTLAKTYIVFPVFEILHLELVVGLAIGFIIGILSVYTPVHRAVTMLSSYCPWPLTESDAVVITMLALTEFVWLWRITCGLGSFGYGNVYRSLSRFHPRLLDLATINLGAIAMLRESDVEDLTVNSLFAKAIMIIAIYANHFIGLLVFVSSLASPSGQEDCCIQKLLQDDYKYVQVADQKVETQPYRYGLHHRRKYSVDKFLTQRLRGYEFVQFVTADWHSFAKPTHFDRRAISVQIFGV